MLKTQSFFQRGSDLQTARLMAQKRERLAPGLSNANMTASSTTINNFSQLKFLATTQTQNLQTSLNQNQAAFKIGDLKQNVA